MFFVVDLVAMTKVEGLPEWTTFLTAANGCIQSRKDGISPI